MVGDGPLAQKDRSKTSRETIVAILVPLEFIALPLLNENSFHSTVYEYLMAIQVEVPTSRHSPCCKKSHQYHL